MKLPRFLALVTAAATLLAAPSAMAQRWVTSGVSTASSGLEGGGGRASATARAQTRMRLGADLAVDESPNDLWGGGILVAVEPRTAFGVDGRYTRLVGEHFGLTAGVMAYLQPGSLFGPLAAAEYRHRLAKSFLLTAGPEANVFLFGTDLPDKTVLWQARFQIGLRVEL